MMAHTRACVSLIIVVTLLIGWSLACGCLTTPPSNSNATITFSDMTFYTEQKPPYNYMENGTLQGISIDLFELITEKMGQKVSRDQIRLVPWDEGYQATLTGNHTMIFAIARIPSRETLFKWAGPIPPYTTVVFAPPDSGILIRELEDLQDYRIGAVRDDAAVQQLRDTGVSESQLVLGSNVTTLIEWALNGKIDLWADSEVVGRYFTQRTTGDPYTFQIVYSFPEIPIYFGFSKDVPDARVQAFQDALDDLKAEKGTTNLTTYDRVIQRYIASVEPGITADDLAWFVQNASMYAASVGRPAALAEFSNKDGQFSLGNMYIYAYDNHRILLAHPYQSGLVGTDRTNYTDIRGMPMIQVGCYTAANGGGFIAYLYPAPKEGVIDEKALDSYEPKIGYVAPVDETWWIGSGIYFSDMMPGGSARPEVVEKMINLVERAAVFGREKGSHQAFVEISNKSGIFVDGEGHYIYAYDFNGTLLAHPYLQEQIGSSLTERRDSFGMETIRALISTAQAGGGYVVFTWPNPDNNNYEEVKIGYVLPVDDSWCVGSGVYISEITGISTPLPQAVIG